ncbi:cytochrome P450 6k1-like isoform X2 [Daktulosphaira vitifoliae]|uniref:cytochrome P450 6k1-like isoform X2 n=1 Tax=Daktulosphaira vitifoliae TaxID=58002 RepID=UPI0021AA8734|nr:cytochrome P450 6k1-like isoform X2 [Daktulosphaira vitifoliae]
MIILSHTMMYITTVIFILLLSIYLYYKNIYNYWKKMGVYHIEPVFFFGNAKERVMFKKSFHEFHRDIYFKFKGHRYAGFYLGRRASLVILDPEIIKCVMIKDFNHFTDRQTMRFRTSEYITQMLINLKGAKWKRMRHLLTPAFTSGKLKTMEHLVDDCCNNMIEFLNTNTNNDEAKEYELEMKDFFGKFTLDVIATCAFGVESNSLREASGGFASRVSKFASLSIFKRLLLYIILLFVPGIARFVPLSFFNMEVIYFLANVIKDAKTHRHVTGQKRNDFLQLLLDGENDTNKNEENKFKEDKLTETQVIAQSVLFLIAGFETSSTLMAFTCYEMALNPDIQTELRIEINKVLKKFNGECTHEAIQEMQLLDMILYETLRKHPPVAQLERVCTQDYKIPDSDLLIKKGTTVQIPVVGLHYDPDYYPNPHKFNPYRFIQEEKMQRSQYVFLPFGTGPRNCIGLRFALMSTKRGMVNLIKNFTIDVSNKTTIPYEYSKYSMLLKAKDGIWLSIKRL